MVSQIFPWRANLLQITLTLTCDFLMILKTLISLIRCVWLGLELNSAGVGKIWGWLVYAIEAVKIKQKMVLNAQKNSGKSGKKSDCGKER